MIPSNERSARIRTGRRTGPVGSSVQPTVGRRPAPAEAAGTFGIGDPAHVYDIGRGEPRYLGRAEIVGVVCASQSRYWVRLEGDVAVRLEVVARTLQGDPAMVLRDLKSHWALCVSKAFFGDPPVPGHAVRSGAAVVDFGR